MASEDFPRVLAMHDYVARSDQELTFRAGDIIICTEIMSDDWYEGQLEGSIGLIAAAYVRHAPDWRALAAAKKPSPIHSPQITRRTVQGTESPAAAHAPPGSGGSPLMHRPSVKDQISVAAGRSPVSRRHEQQQGIAQADARALPGMQTGAVGAAAFQRGASDDELIKPKPIAMQPDRPDLAKALQIRNQAARVGGPTKAGPNELSRHLQQLKTKQSFKGRMSDDPATSELKQRLKTQKEQQESRARVGEVSELESRMSSIGQPRH
eukprot:m.22398 g.22398  ORF g.22398 m.22398 type:complete len:266 (-) comp10728_c0_seq1:27-824(-)